MKITVTCIKRYFPHPHYAVYRCAGHARHEVNCVIAAVTWSDPTCGSVTVVPHFSFLILSSAFHVPHFTYSRFKPHNSINIDNIVWFEKCLDVRKT